MPTLKTILNNIRKELRSKEKVRENAQKDMRKALSLSKQGILLIHQKRFKEAEELLEIAGNTIRKLTDASISHPDIIYSGLFADALQEYSEAEIFSELVREARFATPKEIDVPSVDYVLGLADVIGEFRRSALDALREGDTDKGEKCLRTMDAIYTELMAMGESYMLVPGLRRKCDVARKIIEITRGDVTQEIRRSMLETHLKQFDMYVRKGNKSRSTSRRNR